MASSTRPPAPPSMRPSFYPPAIALLVYPATLIIGSLFSVLSPTAQQQQQQQQQSNPSSSVNPATAAIHPPANYFARKNNIFNVYFVKIGWLWTTLAFAVILLSQSPYTAPSTQRPRRLAQAVARYSLATLAWYLTTQWFFGPAIIDRSFVLSGGKCEHVVPLVDGSDEPPSLKMLLTAATCKSAGGAWRGGHDVSGHVFMLVLATAMLGFEMLGVGLATGGMTWKSGGEDGSASASASASTFTSSSTSSSGLGVWARRFVFGVVGLSWWMLLMTGIWFHTWFEKLTGLLVALATVYTVYILPRGVISWRNVVGVPGV
ncbi:hypothetical protein FE257_010676 [Aspergillus nanangensis]|uniref:Acyl-coenzyme A diphosphatase SCS3 n=1 Tax=Aspergillus nanangensis TaxID=2582783 RepID=A0AAD4CI69_ASPNN|nr:hypothetical protein FE257_010676 [Aspergillus nanangensis]